MFDLNSNTYNIKFPEKITEPIKLECSPTLRMISLVGVPLFAYLSLHFMNNSSDLQFRLFSLFFFILTCLTVYLAFAPQFVTIKSEGLTIKTLYRKPEFFKWSEIDEVKSIKYTSSWPLVTHVLQFSPKKRRWYYIAVSGKIHRNMPYLAENLNRYKKIYTSNN